MTIAVLIVAAGRGTRLGAELPKQYIPLHGPCVLRRTIEAFLNWPWIDVVKVVRHADDAELYAGAVAGLNDPRLLPASLGGDTRAASVARGLQDLKASAPEKVLIHDAARPFVTERLVRDVVDRLDHVPGACAALPVVDALWQAEEGAVRNPVPRDGLWRAQTPQGFRFDAICAAHEAHDGSGTDDVFVARQAGLEVQFVEGDERNYKITTAADLARALRDVCEG